MSVWKMLCFLCFMLVVMFFKGENVTQIFSSINAGFSQHKIQVLEVIKLKMSLQLILGPKIMCTTIHII